MTKKLITEKIKNTSSIDFEGNFEYIIDMLFKAREHAWALGYSDIFIEDSYSSYGDDGKKYFLYGSREETDKEYEQRLEKEAKDKEKAKEQKALKEANDYKEYLLLKKKFEK